MHLHPKCALICAEGALWIKWIWRYTSGLGMATAGRLRLLRAVVVGQLNSDASGVAVFDW